MNAFDKFIAKTLNRYDRDALLDILLKKHSFHKKEWFLQKLYRKIVISLSPKELFTLVYEKNLWGDPQSVSGPGSSLESTKEIRNTLPHLIKDYNMHSLLDIPCGDYNWMQYVDLQNCTYIGADIVDRIIEINNRLFSDENHVFRVLDIIRDDLPEVDLILCRDCLVHLTFNDAKAALKNIRRSGSKYLLATTFTECKINSQLGIDCWRPINLEKQPFTFPRPVLIIRENCEQAQYKDKSLGLWRVSDLLL